MDDKFVQNFDNMFIKYKTPLMLDCIYINRNFNNINEVLT